MFWELHVEYFSQATIIYQKRSLSFVGVRALLIATIYSRLNAIDQVLGEAGWQVSGFQNPKEALDSLTNKDYAAVFCDENLRGASAGGFLAWTRRTSAELPFYLISTTADTESAANNALLQRNGGPSAVLPFPLKAGAVPKPTSFTDAGTPTPPQPIPRTPLSGNTSLVPISSLLEMMGIASQSAHIELGEAGSEGLVSVEAGKLVHAEAKGEKRALSGLPALAHFILLENCPFRVLPYEKVTRPTINMPATTALTEAARLADEQGRYKQLIDAVKHSCPATDALATGYLLAKAPQMGHGDADGLFRKAQKILGGERSLWDGKLSVLYASTDTRALAVVLFGDDNLLAAQAPAQHREQLFEAVRQALELANG